ncbi:MAG: hypothetical protein NUV51_11090 [Sulfuricaulis sp.]|nr:hypothetical protein [Sulfuricaulis sp.]
MIQSGEIITVSIRVPAPVLVATALNPAIITFSGVIRPPVLSAQILTGNDATFYGTVVAPILVAAGYPVATITFAGFVPAPYLSAAMSAAVASAYRTWVLNTRKGALTEYNNFSFNSYAVFNGVVLGCGPSGIVTLGTQDADGSTAIGSTVKSGADNFGTSVIKRVPRIYLDYKTTGDAQFKMITTEGGSRTYALNWNSVTGTQTRRIPVGKGPKSVRWQWEYTNVAGADFDLNAVLAYPTATRRRVQ